MPLRRVLKAASTPSEPDSWAAAGGACFFGVATAFGVAAGFAPLVFVLRGRSVVVEEFELWATTTPHVRRMKANTLSINKLLTRLSRCVIFGRTRRGRGYRKSRTSTGRRLV